MGESLEVMARKLHSDSIVMDMTAPLINDSRYWDSWIAGGATVAAPTIGWEGIRDAVQHLGIWLKHLHTNPDKFVHVTTVADIYRAKRERKLGIFFHFQNSLQIERDLTMLEVYHRLGVRMIQLTYNVKNYVGNGCEERSDDGLSNFGIRVVKEMNRLGIVVDCSHTGYRTTYDALEFSERPVVLSHSNARALCDNDRNAPDELIKAIARHGGLLGLNGTPCFIKRDTDHPSVDDLVDHADHICQLTGSADHVSVGIDYAQTMAGVLESEAAYKRQYEGYVASGQWLARNYTPTPYHMPKGIDTPATLYNLTVALKRRGYADADVQKILGLNWIRVLQAYGM